MRRIESIRDLREGWRDEVVGEAFDERLRRLMMEKHVEECLEEAPRMREACMVTVLDDRNRIQDIGFNEPSDLILDNFGKWLAAMFKPIGKAIYTQPSFIDVTNTTRNLYIFTPSSNTSNFFYSGSYVTGSRFQIGSSSTAPARTDYKIGTAFTASPESGRVNMTNSSYSSGAITHTGSLTAGGSGTIREVGYFVTTLNYEFMWFHDSVTDTAFSAGNAVTATYTVSL